MAKKKKEEVKEEPKHVLTLNEYDVLTMDMQCLGADWERKAIIEELQRRRIQLIDIANSAGKSELEVESRKTAEGLFIAINFIEKLPAFESRCECQECGAI